MTKTHEVLKKVEVQTNGYNLIFDSPIGYGVILTSDNFYRPFKFSFGNSTYTVKNFMFYKDGEILFEEKSGWLQKDQWKDYKSVKFGKHEKIKRVSEKDIQKALENSEKYGVFFESLGRDRFDRENKATVYVPIEYLENIGYEYIRYTTNTELATSTVHHVLGGENNELLYIVNGYVETVQHKENYKKVMMDELEKAQSTDDLKAFMDKWKDRVKNL